MHAAVDAYDVPMRVVFAGTPEVAVPSLEAIVAAGHDVVAVLTQPDAPGKRGKALVPSPVKVAAQRLGIEVFTPVRASDPETVEYVSSLEADVAAVVAYGQLLKAPLRAAVTHGWVNLHFSLLPAWRGAAPVQRSIQAGDDLTGATTFVIDKGMDTGPVIGHLTEVIKPSDTSGDLLDRLAFAGAPLLVKSLELLVSGEAKPAPQSLEGVSHAAKLSRDDALVRWELPAHVIDRTIRACTPAPGAWTTLPDGTPAKLGPVTLLDMPATTPGLVSQTDSGITVGTGTQPIALSWIQPAGKKAMDATSWWRGTRLETAMLGES